MSAIKAGNFNPIEEIELQKQIIESLLEKIIELEAKIEAVCELLIAEKILDEDSIRVCERDHYFDMVDKLTTVPEQEDYSWQPPSY